MEKFLGNLKEILDCSDFSGASGIEVSRRVIEEINRFLYTNYEGIGVAPALDREFELFSDFHRFWKDSYREILNPRIDDVQCALVADGLHRVYEISSEAFCDLYDTCGLEREDVCRIRFFSAAQDFRGSRSFSDFAEVFKGDPGIFSTRRIYEDPEGFLKEVGVAKLSQGDKRASFAKRSAGFLIEKGIEPYDMLAYYDRSLLDLKRALIGVAGMGFGNKKADMFLRDMVVHGVWEEYFGFEQLDVASDVNTMKVALRTGMLKTEIPLVSSFLDIFCYQYALIDEMNAAAWRRVWEIWSERYPNECVPSPCLIDYFVYRVIGRECCGDKMSVFKGDKCAHEFCWHSSRNRTCQVCRSADGSRNRASLVKKLHPCTCKEEPAFFHKVIAKKFPNLKALEGCPFKVACLSSSGSAMLQPPKSISILGRTGWETAYARTGEGGGGLQA